MDFKVEIERGKEIQITPFGSSETFDAKIISSYGSTKDPPHSASVATPVITIDSSGSMFADGICINTTASEYDVWNLDAQRTPELLEHDRQVEETLQQIKEEAELFALKTFTNDSSLTIEKLRTYANQSPIPIFDERLGQGTLLYRSDKIDHLWGYLYDFVFESASLGDFNRYVDLLNYRLNDQLAEAMYSVETGRNHDALYDFFYYNEERIFDILTKQFELQDVLYDIGYKFVRESEFGLIVQQL